MKMVNDQTMKSFDNFKDQIFRSKVDNFKNKQKANITSSLTPNKISSIIPWRFITKISFFTSIIYLTYQYHQNAIQYLITKGHLNQIDFLVYDTVFSDLTFRIKSLTQINNLNTHVSKQRFANKLYKSKLEQHYNYLTKRFVPYVIKSQVNSKWKIWITGFQNLQKCIFVNQFGDVIERHQTSKIRLWNYPIWKRTKDRVISIQPSLKTYECLLTSKNQLSQNPISQQIIKKCEKINFLNRFSNNYSQAVEQCKQNYKIGVKIDDHIKDRLNFIKKIDKQGKTNNINQKLQ